MIKRLPLVPFRLLSSLPRKRKGVKSERARDERTRRILQSESGETDDRRLADAGRRM
jgi:hypothetical protein